MYIKYLLKSFIAISIMSYPMHSIATVNYNAVDTDINSTVVSKLSSDKSLSGTTINVKTSKGIVSLSGNVDSDTQASAATEIAQSTPYVKDVNTKELTIKGSQQPVADSIITAKIRGLFLQKKLFGDKDIAAMSISVETNNGTVSLSGTADNKKQIQNAIVIAKSITGVKEVNSSVTISTVTQ